MAQKTVQLLAQQRLKRFLEQDSNSTPYLIMTLFGDSVIPHGGEIWMGSLVALLAPLGINERLVRTSVFRLTKDGWLRSRKKGRKSYYRACQRDEIEHNEQRIYYQQEKWDGHWRLVIGLSMAKATPKIDAFKKHLIKQGFCAIASNVFGHPTFATEEIQQLLTSYDVNDAYTVMLGQNPDGNPLEYERIGRALHRCTLDDLEHSYTKLISLYQPLYRQREALRQLEAEPSFFIRLVMINDYRRVLWHDTVRSNLMFGSDWAGRQARQIVASIYCAIEPQSSNYFETIGQNETGTFTPAAKRYQQRFKYLI